MVDLNDPAMPPPRGVQPNFVNPPTLMREVIITAVFALTLMTTCVVLRAYVKIFILRKQQIEDWFCYWAWAGVVTYTGILLYIEDYGFARHQWDVTAGMFQHIMYYVNILYCVYSPTTLPAKLSVLFQIKRIFTTPERDIVYWVVWASIIFNTIFYSGLFFTYVFTCWPREAIWNPNVPGRCISAVSSNMAAGVLNLISDVEALLLPAWAIWHLHMPVERKMAVFAVFSVGMIACVIGMVGIYFRVLLLTEPDFTWLCTKAAMLVVSEMAVVVIVGCFPTFPRLIHHVRAKRGQSVKGYESRTRMSQKYGKNKEGGTLKKYMGPGVSTTLTNSNERLELHSYNTDPEQGRQSSRQSEGGEGILKMTCIDQSIVNPDAR